MPFGNSMQDCKNSVLQSGVPIGNTVRLLRKLRCRSFVPNGNSMLFTNSYDCFPICAIWQHYASLRKSRIIVVQCQIAYSCSLNNALIVSPVCAFWQHCRPTCRRKYFYGVFTGYTLCHSRKLKYSSIVICCNNPNFITRTRHKGPFI